MSEESKRDIIDRLAACAGPWSDYTLAQDAITEIKQLREELQHVRHAFRVNILRLAPQTPHEEIDRVLHPKD